MMTRKIITFLLALILIYSLIPATVFADKDQMFNPVRTNTYYRDIIQGLKANGTYSALQGTDNFHDSHIWALQGWMRALLVTSLTADLDDYDEAMYKKYIPKMKDCYVAATPNFLEEGLVYRIIILNDKNDALTITYIPDSTATGYDEIKDYKPEYNDNLEEIGTLWEVTDKEFGELMETGIVG